MMRFHYDSKTQVTKKKHDILNCPPTLKIQNGSSYTLGAIVNHIGSSPNVGHYNTLLYNSKEDNYILLDDTSFNINVEINDNMKKTHYLVMYYKD